MPLKLRTLSRKKIFVESVMILGWLVQAI